MPLYVADYRADTAHLSAAQHGAYLLLIMHYWATGALPKDDAAMARIACMSPAEWKRNCPIIYPFFDNDWRHKRIDAELARAADISSKRSASAKQRRSNSSANAEQVDTHAGATSPSQPQSQKDSEPIGSGAEAPIDHRKRLFDVGLKKLAAMTGKGPDACRSFVGKCLKAASDDAITVLGLIEEAERNQAVDPSAWIAARLKPVEIGNGRRTVHDAAKDLTRHLQALAAIDEPAPSGLCEQEGGTPLRLLPSR